jgi:ABC-type multidrug transport system fused ATPase/permease subunit
LFGGAALMSAFFRLGLLWANTRASFLIGSDLSYQIYKQTMLQDYKFHVTMKSSEIISAITMKCVQTAQSIILPCLSLISNTITLLSVTILLGATNLSLTFGSMAIILFIYGLIALLSKPQLRKDSGSVAKGLDKIVRSVQEGLGAIKHVIIDKTHDIYVDEFRRKETKLRRAQGNITIISASPRYIIEGVVLFSVALIVYYLYLIVPDGTETVIPTIGTFMIAFQKCLPLVQASFASITFIIGGKSTLADVLFFQNRLNQEKIPHVDDTKSCDEIIFNDHIELRNVSYAYSQGLPTVLKDINLIIPKGSSVGITGSSGAGKTTLLDILLGLLEPKTGGVYVDDTLITTKNLENFHNKLSHVSQNVFLADTTIIQNIALAEELNDIDQDRAVKAAMNAQIHDTITNLELGYHSEVGEGGGNLSGGQRQRLALARALYSDKDILVLDEATSALDDETEMAIIDAIAHCDKNITVIMVAHRLSSLKHCQYIYDLNTRKLSHRKDTTRQLNSMGEAKKP